MVSFENLERYWDIVTPERAGKPTPNYQYNPRVVLEKLLSCLTPDPKGLVVAGMGDEINFSESELSKNVNKWLKSQGASHPFPLKPIGGWVYLTAGSRQEEGPLVQMGAVIKEPTLSASGIKDGYQRSIAGRELVPPLVQRAVDFVLAVDDFNLTDTEKPKYKSMGRILRGVQEHQGRSQLLTIFDTAQFLVKNNGQHKQAELIELFPDRSAEKVRDTIDKLGLTGVITVDSESPLGLRRQGKVLNLYTLTNTALGEQDFSEIYNLFKVVRPKLRNFPLFQKVWTHLNEYPNGEYGSKQLASILEADQSRVAQVLTGLESLGILEVKNSGPAVGEESIKISANDFTHLLWESVLEPALQTAENLTPQTMKAWDGEKLDLFITNYLKERIHRGPQTGTIIRDTLLDLMGDPAIRLVDLVVAYNRHSGNRDLPYGSVRRHMEKLVEEKKVISPAPGSYQRVD